MTNNYTLTHEDLAVRLKYSTVNIYKLSQRGAFPFILERKKVGAPKKLFHFSCGDMSKAEIKFNIERSSFVLPREV